MKPASPNAIAAALIAHSNKVMDERDRLKASNAELVAALQECCSVFDRMPVRPAELEMAEETALAAIAAATEKPAD